MPKLNQQAFKIMLDYLCSILLSGLLTCNGLAVTTTTSTNNGAVTGAGNSHHANAIDRIKLVNEQIGLLKSRLAESEHDFSELQRRDGVSTALTINKVSKGLLSKVALDISVAKSNLDGINLEQVDTVHTIAWLEKNIQEMKNQMNILNIFGLSVAKSEVLQPHQLTADLKYQQRLLELEKVKLELLKKLQLIATNIFAVHNDSYNRIALLLKSRNLMHLKQEQAQDELIFQREQQAWLQKLSALYTKLSKTDPIAAHNDYVNLEREIYLTNEKANYAYMRALIARYTDQMQQMRTAVTRSNSISLLNEISDHLQLLNKQLEQLNTVLNTRTVTLQKHLDYLNTRQNTMVEFTTYLAKLNKLQTAYLKVQQDLTGLVKKLAGFRGFLETELKRELSARQGFSSFAVKTWLDFGKELLLVPTLTFQIIKSISNAIVHGISKMSWLGIVLLIIGEITLYLIFAFVQRFLFYIEKHSTAWREHITSRWLGLQCLARSLFDIFLTLNIIAILFIFEVATQNYLLIMYLAVVWLIFKNLLIIARVCLLETTHTHAGDDVLLYKRLRLVIVIGGITTAVTVFLHQLPLIYELKAASDYLFLILMMAASLLLLYSRDLIPNLIIVYIDEGHPYLRRSIRIIGTLIPVLMLVNAVIGLMGYVNLIMTVSWYEGIFLIVLIGYLILRGLLSDGMEHLSRLIIRYVQNGWLWTEAILKPLDTVLKVMLFLVAGAVLFILYGWDKQSPIVERLTDLLNYSLLTILHTQITSLTIIKLCITIAIFYWAAKWSREFVYRLLLRRTSDLGVRNSMAILSQYLIIVLGILFCLRVVGIDFQALALVAGMFAFGIGLGLRDLANNFACGFLMLLERPIRVGDIVSIGGMDGEVTHIGGRAVTVRTWDYLELVVPNVEIFNKTFSNWTARDNIVRSLIHVKISRHDNPHAVREIIRNVLFLHPQILQDPAPEVFLKDISDVLMDFELRYYVNIRQISSRTSVISSVLMQIWDAFAEHGIKPPYPMQEIVLHEHDSGKKIS